MIFNSQARPLTKVLSTIFVILLVLGSAFVYAYYYTNLLDSLKQDQPPSLELDNAALKGGLASGIGIKYYTFSAAAVTNYVDQTFDTSELRLLKNGINYVYSPSDVTVEEIIQKLIIPTTGNKVLLAYWDPAGKKFNLYPEGPYKNTITVTNPGEYTIPAFHGFIILSKDNTKIWKIRSADVPLTEEDVSLIVAADQADPGSGIVHSLNTVGGWIMVPLPVGANLKELLEPFKKRLQAISTLENYTTWNEASNNFDISLTKGIAWLKLGDFTCNDGEHYEYGGCEKCDTGEYYDGDVCSACPDGEIPNSNGNACVPPVEQVPLEKFTNTSFETDLSNWDTGVQPDSISGLQLWLKADAITGLNSGDAVSTWIDSSGNGRDATQGIVANKPIYKTNIINGKPVVKFSGSSSITHYLDIPILSVTQPFTIFTVGKMNGNGVNGNSDYFYDDADSSCTANSRVLLIINPYGNDPSIITIYAGAVLSVVNTTFGLNTIYTSIFDSTNSALLANGSNIVFGNAGTINLSRLRIGSRCSVSNGLNGDIAEIIIYNSALSSTTRSRIENYLRNKYDIGVSSGIISVTKDTIIKYGDGAGSAKLITSSTDTGEFTQSVNVGDTNTYNLSAYAYTDGTAVTSSDVELFYNDSTVSTAYTSAGNGWYKLTGTVTGANASRRYGVQVKAKKTVYIDNMSLNN